MTEAHASTASKSINHNQTEVVIRPLMEHDRERLLSFGASLPADDVLYLEDDYHSVEIITRLVNAAHAENWRQVVAIAGDQIVGYSAVRRLPGWSSHVGDIRLIMHPDWRRNGLGTELARAIFEAARQLEVDKIIVEMLATQAAGRSIFERLGFQIEGILKDHARDRQGKCHDLLIVAYHMR